MWGEKDPKKPSSCGSDLVWWKFFCCADRLFLHAFNVDVYAYWRVMNESPSDASKIHFQLQSAAHDFNCPLLDDVCVLSRGSLCLNAWAEGEKRIRLIGGVQEAWEKGSLFGRCLGDLAIKLASYRAVDTSSSVPYAVLVEILFN